MGGWGSGRSGGSDCTDSCHAIDIRRWQREGLLDIGRRFNWQWSSNGQVVADINVKIEDSRVILNYRVRLYGGQWHSMEYPINLTTTPCNYGGARNWFICPAIGCSRRVALLYGSDRIFACRYCYQLAYRSQRETASDRFIRRAEKIRTKLGWEAGMLNLGDGKPKGMHWKTYYRLQDEHDAIVEKSLCSLMSRFGY